MRCIAKMLMPAFLATCFLFCSHQNSNLNTVSPEAPVRSNKDTLWADSIMKTMSIEEKIGQLFMMPAYSNKPEEQENVAKMIRNNHIGGLIFMQGGPVRQANMTNYFQSQAKVPLLISIDGEWGLAMRLDSTFRFPRQMTLGAIQNDTLIYDMASEIAKHCKRLGIHMNLAPVVDINNNPKNPVINDRSFGEDPIAVTRKGYVYMRGLQDNRVIACAKHFPGHGDTDTDSHYALPVIKHSHARMDSIELYPFKTLTKYGLMSVMVAHLNIPAYDTTKNQASTLSKNIVTGLLRDSIGFNGLVVTDALNMEGVTKYYKPGETDVKAFLAGNDILLFPRNIPTAVVEIKKAIASGEISEADLDARCRKILLFKYWCGLHSKPKVDTTKLYEELNNPESALINRKLIEASLTVLKNQDSLIPFRRLDTLKIAALCIGENQGNAYQRMLKNFASVDCFSTSKTGITAAIPALKTKLAKYNVVIISMHSNSTKASGNFGVPADLGELVNALSANSKVVLDVFSNPYSLIPVKHLDKAASVVVSYQNCKITQELSAQMLFGATKASGRLPVGISSTFPMGTGIETEKLSRLKYTIPEESGINFEHLLKIDTIAQNAIREKAFPGCQVLVAHKGMVIYNKAFGYHDYSNTREVNTDDIYDLASVTKIAATTFCMMKLDQEEKIDINRTIGHYLPELDSSTKSNLTIKQILSHRAGLASWIPFYKKTMSGDTLLSPYYRTEASDSFPHLVADGLYSLRHVEDSMMERIKNHPLRTKKTYLYSDLGFYLLKRAIERITGDSIQNYVYRELYLPMGASTLGYRPLERHDATVITPTEDDKSFRKKVIQGYVHDPGAAMLGGVGGHAGLFSNANDIGKIMQMYLQRGEYGGVQYIQSAVFDTYNTCHYKGCRRGLGLDKPEPAGGGPTCRSVSPQSFGHTGFTGVIVWADPREQLVYVFLSNRVHPDAENKKISTLDIRTSIQQVIYDAIDKSRKSEKAQASRMNLQNML
jgi:beta-N-acetylhexosaminidase